MKRIYCMGFAVLMTLMIALSGCETQPAQDAAPALTASEWVDVLSEAVPFDDQMTQTDQAAAIYGILPEDGYTGACDMMISTMATPEEIAVFQADGVYSLEALTALAQKRLAQQKESYASYAPQEVPKLDSAVVESAGDCLIVCVCADNEAAREVIRAHNK